MIFYWIYKVKMIANISYNIDLHISTSLNVTVTLSGDPVCRQAGKGYSNWHILISQASFKSIFLCTTLSVQFPDYLFQVPVQFCASRWFCCISSLPGLHQKFVNRAFQACKVYNQVLK